MELKIRKAREDDVSLLYIWVNNDDVRRNALNPKKIKWEEHEAWFEGKMSNPYSKIFILENINHPIGQIRYDRKDEGFWDIDFFIDKKFRGMGLGQKIIELSLNKISGIVRAVVKKENVASCKVFEKLGFQREENEEGIYQYKFK